MVITFSHFFVQKGIIDILNSVTMQAKYNIPNVWNVDKISVIA